MATMHVENKVPDETYLNDLMDIGSARAAIIKRLELNTTRLNTNDKVSEHCTEKDAYCGIDCVKCFPRKSKRRFER